MVHNKLKTYSTLRVLYGLSHLSGLKYTLPTFWPQVKNHNVKSNILKKNTSQVIARVHNIVILLKNLEENLKHP